MGSNTKRIIQAGLFLLAVAACLVDCRLLWLAIVPALLLEAWTRPRYLDYIWKALRPDQLPRSTYRHFDRWTPEFMALGCGLVGDFQLSRVPWPTYVRYVLPPDRRIKGDISQADDAVAPCFNTIFDDGRMIETALFDQNLTKFGEHLKLWMQCVRGASIAELYAQHQRQVDLYESTYGAKALTVTPDRLYDFAQYGHKLLWWQRNELPARYGVPQVPVEGASAVSATTAAR
jgi:hypothetical protein